MPSPLLSPILALVVLSWIACPGAIGGGPPAWGGLRDLAGQEARPLESKATRFLVFIFVRTDCPVANVYAPEIQRLAKVYGAAGVAFHLVYSDPEESPEAIRKHLADFGYALPAYRDPKLEFARRSKVKVTPESALYAPDGKLLYHGRIDDRYADLGQARPAPTERDLVRALEAVLAGRAAPVAGGAAVGCAIEGL